MLRFQKILEVTNGKILQYHKDYSIAYLLTDTRNIISPEGSLFFAIAGTRHNGHHFIIEAYQKGVRQFIIEHATNISLTNFTEANFIEVGSSLEALQQLASYHRQQFQLPVLAITGSNGKTIVKEWLAQLLNKNFQVVKSPKSYNSQIGVPLSVWQLNHQHTFAIFEAGISLPGEMEKLEKIIKPTLGIFTNIGTAHDEGFTSQQQKTIEKLKLFQNTDRIFYCLDHAELHTIITSPLHPVHSFTWSRSNSAAYVHLKKVKENLNGTVLEITYREQLFSLSTHFKDEASIENLMHCISVLLYLNFHPEDIQKNTDSLHAIAMRLEVKEGINGCAIIDDAYNNDLAGLSIALNFLAHQKQRERKTVILSDVLESGIDQHTLYTEIAHLLKEKHIHRLIGIGPVFSAHRHLFTQAEFYDNTDEFVANLGHHQFSKEIILVKGARVYQFEKIVKSLQERVHGTLLEINLDALVHNLNFYRSNLKSGTKIMVMVKALAYGAGSTEVANLLEFHRVDYLGVAYADEGVALRQEGITLPIMVMNPSVESFAKLLEYHLEPELYSFKILHEFISHLKTNEQTSKVHIKVDTGMKRLGFETDDLVNLLETLRAAPEIMIASAFTHLAGADESHHNIFSHQQIEAFNAFVSSLSKSLEYGFLKHCLNSAGIIRFPDQQMDMVRLGIGLYGVEANKMKQHELRHVGTLKTVISQIKNVNAGESVGYSRNGRLTTDARIATIAIGYADGYSRRFGNGNAEVWINGTRCPTVGNVCMDMTMVDVTHAGANEGDEVIVFGTQMPVTVLAEKAGTIPYEILTGVSERVKRVFYAE